MHLARLLLLAMLALALSACGGDDEGDAGGTTAAPAATTAPAATPGECEPVEAPAPRDEETRSAPTEPLASGRTYRLVVATNCGSFTIELDQESAPNTAASLVQLSRDGYFDGTTFHRVVPGFVIQGGDPTGTGAGGPGYQTVDPPAADATYTQGVVAMAKAELEAAGTSGSQFFVVTGQDAGLPPEYAVVGTVTDGLDTVLAIDALGVGDGPPSQPVVMQSVTVEEA